VSLTQAKHRVKLVVVGILNLIQMNSQARQRNIDET